MEVMEKNALMAAFEFTAFNHKLHRLTSPALMCFGRVHLPLLLTYGTFQHKVKFLRGERYDA